MKVSFIVALFFSLGSISAFAEQVNLEDFFVELHDHEIMAVTTLADLRVGSELRRHASNVRNCGDDLSHVMLRVENAGLHVAEAGVIYTDGTRKVYNFSYNFPAGYDSPWVDIDRIRRPGKCLKSVYVVAKSRSANTASRVKVIGNTH